jgi:hypothetical protein
VSGQLARTRGKKKGRGIGFLFLAGLTLLVAGFVARHEIPFLLEQAGQSPARPAQADTGNRNLTGGMPDYRPPAGLYAGAGAMEQKRAQAAASNSNGSLEKNAPRENITNSEREQLNRVIKEKAR